jgi:hypothetical protein
MTEVAAKKAASASAMSVIVTAFLTWIAANKYTSDSAHPTAPTGRVSATLAKADATRPPVSTIPLTYDEALALRPLRDAVFGEGSERGKESMQSLRAELEQADPVGLRSLVAAVPNPSGSLGFRFDETIDSIERAARAYGYVLERWRLPWSESSDQSKPEIASDKKGQPPKRESSPSKPASSSPQPVAGDPGVLVFRRANRALDQAPNATDLLLVFLVTETPTQGVDRLAMTRALSLAEALGEPRKSDLKPSRGVNIIAPCFSGSMPSLRDGLRDWLASINDAETGKFDVEILSGTASAFDKSQFLRAIRQGQFTKLREVNFSSMTHRFEDTMDVVLDFLGRKRNDKDVAILSEIDTGFGESVGEFPEAHPASQSGKDGSSIGLQYPSQIAEIRRRYELQGLMKNGASAAFGSVDELRGRGDAEGSARDVFPDQAPDWTALSENRALTQVLRYLEDSQIKVIGIIGTDPRDTIFLARLIKRYCPDARLFTIGSDLVYLDSESITELRGMIIGSTYPLYAANHAWTGSDRRSRGQVFPSEDAQGVYNAAVVQIARLTGMSRADNETEQEKNKRRDQEGKNLFEYSTPIALRRGFVSDLGMPPVWVSVVGERSLYPVDCRMFEPDKLKCDCDYMYLTRGPHAGPRRLVINRALAWAVFLFTASLVLVISYIFRLRQALPRSVRTPPVSRSPSSAGELALTLARLLILAGYFYVACPALAQLVPGTVELNLASHSGPKIFAHAIVITPIVVTLAAFLASIAEFRASRSLWRAAEALGTAFVVFLVGYIQVRSAAYPRWLLSLDRSAAITGGVSAYVPVAFLMAALGAWLYARRRIRKINDNFAFTPEYHPAAVAASAAPGTNQAILKRIDVHRARFDRWFVAPGDFFRISRDGGVSWSDWNTTLIVTAFLIGTFVDTLLFRPVSLSDEGWLFDLFFRVAFGLLLTLLSLNFARLHSAWRDFRAVLDGLARILGEAFERIPRNVSNWLIDAESCNAEYGYLISRQSSAARKLLTGWDQKIEMPRSRVAWDTEEALRQLSVIERHSGEDRRSSFDEKGEEVASFRYFARALNPHWESAEVAQVAQSDRSALTKEKTESTREETLIHHLEDLLALEAVRWVGGALVRVWISIGFLVLSSAAMLFAITSYPFPEQSRVMTVIGFAIAALVVMILRVALGSSRNEVISKIDGTTPGRITWDSTLLSSIAAYVVPLLGLLTAVSFDMLDLFRSVLGPILRIFP